MRPMETKGKRDGRRAGLACCEGFGVYGPATRIGVVESVRFAPETGAPNLLVERRIALRSGGLLSGPRQAA